MPRTAPVRLVVQAIFSCSFSEILTSVAPCRRLGSRCNALPLTLLLFAAVAFGQNVSGPDEGVQPSTVSVSPYESINLANLNILMRTEKLLVKRILLIILGCVLAFFVLFQERIETAAVACG